jgi:hypothetical protein
MLAALFSITSMTGEKNIQRKRKKVTRNITARTPIVIKFICAKGLSTIP